MEVLNEIVDSCVEIAGSKKYWFVRSDGGRLYKSFNVQGLISIGYPELTLNDIYPPNKTVKEIKKSLTEKATEIYSEHKMPGLIASQVIRFVYEIEAGDVVIVPSFSSDYLLFGIVSDSRVIKSNIYVDSNDGEKIDPDFTKVKAVDWVTQVPKYKYAPQFFQMFSSQQAVFQVNDYARWIDPVLYDFYKKDGKYNLRLNIRRHNGIKFRELFSTCLDVLDFGDELLVDLDIPEDTSGIETRINLNSPGTIDLVSYAPYILALIGLIVIFVNGGGLKCSIKRLGLDFEVGTSSFLDRINNALNSRQDRKLKKALGEKLRDLQISDSQEVTSILGKINERNQNK